MVVMVLVVVVGVVVVVVLFVVVMVVGYYIWGIGCGSGVNSHCYRKILLVSDLLVHYILIFLAGRSKGKKIGLKVLPI